MVIQILYVSNDEFSQSSFDSTIQVPEPIWQDVHANFKAVCLSCGKCGLSWGIDDIVVEFDPVLGWCFVVEGFVELQRQFIVHWFFWGGALPLISCRCLFDSSHQTVLIHVKPVTVLVQITAEPFMVWNLNQILIIW